MRKNRFCIPRPLISAAIAGLAVFLTFSWTLAAPLSGGTLPPENVPKYTEPLIIPPVLPPQGQGGQKGNGNTLYQIAVRQRQQQILPPAYDPTTIWSYANFVDPQGGPRSSGTFNYPSFTIEVRRDETVRVRWVNELVDERGNYLPHLFAVDQTLHWANPPMDCLEGDPRTDCRGDVQSPYTGPVPIVTHVHGSHVDAISDGYPEAWWLPAAKNIPDGYATEGSNYGSVQPAPPGSAWYEYDNSQPAATLWFHDHTLGMTRLNVYAGPAGFWLIRDDVEDALGLPGPAPVEGEDPNGDPAVRAQIREVPIAIQDRSFNTDGSLFYPDNRQFFERFASGNQNLTLDIPFIPDETNAIGPDDNNLISDVSPIWNPEFFGNTIVVNGRTWPYYEVEPDQYRLRLLNGCNSRFLILQMDPDETTFAPDSNSPTSLSFTQIGADSGLLPSPVTQNDLLLGPAERADVIVDFTDFAPGDVIYMINLGPDEPFGGGTPGVEFTSADPGTTGQVMKFVVVDDTGLGDEFDDYTVPDPLVDIQALEDSDPPRKLSLNEEVSSSVCVINDGNSITEVNSVPYNPAETFETRCQLAGGEVFAPVAALLGTLQGNTPTPKLWSDTITETPILGDTETWEIYNFTEDAHPIHLHLVAFQVIDRQAFNTETGALIGGPVGPEPSESGFKDTVIAYPGEITRIRATFDKPGLFVWHCHILEHEDNEMMRPLFVKENQNTPVPEP